mmetsp:Transcript_63388/g.196376  ORF Transcript_63388/g.196376 Transcript_63388/m.196376 type:complete len:257 (+) Transcript_63388:938-1708(+)
MPSSSAAACVRGMPTWWGTGSLGAWPGASKASSSTFFSSRWSTSESWSTGMFRSMRADVCAKTIAEGSLVTAALTTSRSARRGPGMCCKARPAFLATSMQKALSHCSSSVVCLNASASRMAQAMTKFRSARSSSATPAKAEPWPARQRSKMKSLSARRSSLTPVKALPFNSTTSLTNFRFARSEGSASIMQFPLNRTASRTSVRSALRPTSACTRARPPLAQIAAYTRSRSARTSPGAWPNWFQSARTMARQQAWR